MLRFARNSEFSLPKPPVISKKAGHMAINPMTRGLVHQAGETWTSKRKPLKDSRPARLPTTCHGPLSPTLKDYYKTNRMFDLSKINCPATPVRRQTEYRHYKGLFMFHKNVLNSLRSGPLQQIQEPPHTPKSPIRLALVASGSGVVSKKGPSPLYDLISITAHRCSSFFAEAAVLVLVLALLDRFMLKGRMELSWVFSAFTISLTLLAASVLTEFSSRRRLQSRGN
jgi:hypothetical protein